MALFYPPSVNGLQKTLDAQLDSGSTASMTLNNTTNVQNKPGVVVINRIDSDGNEKTASLREYVSYTGTSGATLTGLTRNADGGTSDQDHAVGSVVEFVPDVVWAEEINTTITAEHTTSGAHDFKGNEVVIDDDGDTTMTADTDDQIDFKVGGNDRFRLKATDMDLVAAAANIQVAGADPKRAYYIPAQGMFGATTSGAASGQYESSSNKNNIKYLAFDTSSDEFAHFSIPSPSNWDAGTVTAKFYWTTESGGAAETVTWGIQGVATANDDTLDVAYGTAQTVADTWTADDDLHVTSATSAITIAGSPVAGEWLDFRVYRDVSEDDLGGDAWLLGVRIEFGIAQYNDA